MAARNARKPASKKATGSSSSEASVRVVLEIPESRKRALKAKAATEGLSIKDYILRLLERDGV